MSEGKGKESGTEEEQTRRNARRRAQKLMLVEHLFNTLADRMWVQGSKTDFSKLLKMLRGLFWAIFELWSVIRCRTGVDGGNFPN